MGELPAKLFFRIGEVAGLVGVEPHVLRYWEREFRSIRPTKSAKGQRVYSRKDVENLLRVRDLLYRDGFTIAGAKKKLQRTTSDVDPIEAGIESGETAKEDDGPAFSEDDDDDDGVSSEVVPRVVIPQPTTLKDRLIALRSEVEAFLDELNSNGDSDKNNNGR
jgi:DNA-binding transcriptional MerR regulator